MHLLVTGAAGLIAGRVVELLLAAGHTLTGLDNLNDAYDVRLKDWRLQRLLGRPGFAFQQRDITHRPMLAAIWENQPAFDAVIHLAARSGVRSSVADPMPHREDADTSRPLSQYAASKQAAETLCYTYLRTDSRS